MGLFQPLFIGPESGKLRDSKVNEIWDQLLKHSHYGKTVLSTSVTNYRLVKGESGLLFRIKLDQSMFFYN